MDIRRILTLVLSLMIVFSGVVFAAGDFSDVIEETSSVFSLPDETVKSAFSEFEVYGNTDTNLSNNIKSTSSVVVKSVGKNLFDGELEQGSISTSGTNISDVQAVRTKDYIPVKAGNTYVKSNSLNHVSGRIAFYNNGVFVSAITDVASFTVPQGANEVRFAIYYTSTITPSDVEWVQLELGSTATTYAKYEKSEANFEAPFKDSVFKSIDDVHDYVDKDGNAHQLISDNLILDGSRSWSTYTVEAGTDVDTIAFKIVISDKKDDSSTTSIQVLSDKFGSFNADDFYSNDVESITGRNQEIRIRVLRSKLTTKDVDGFITWLGSNNITLIYQLETPTTTQLTPQNLIAYPNGTIIVETEEDSTLPTIKYSVQIDTGDQVENHEEQINGIFDIFQTVFTRLEKLEKNTPSIAPIYINCIQDKEINVALTVANIRDVDQRTFTVTYSTDDFILQDLCTSTETMENSTITSTYPIDETDIVILENTIDGTVGTVKFRVNKYVSYGNSWSGVVNTMAFKANESGQKSITFEVE